MYMDALARLRYGTLDLAFRTWLEMTEAAREERRAAGGNLSASEEAVERARLRARADSAEIVTLKAKVAALEGLVEKLINTPPPPPPPVVDISPMVSK